MSRKLFGTDGVRGKANTYPMTAEMALRIGAAAGIYFRRNHSKVHRVVIGKDTRRSGYMLESALTAGFTSTGMSVFLMGPIPTPAVGMLTPSMRADLGIMISASHNPHEDNGIKFFGPDGYKLSDEAEMEIEALVASGGDLVEPMKIGRTRHIYDGRSRYNERVKAAFPSNLSLGGMKVVIDCANGAAYRAAPEVLWELGAEVIPVGVSPNGYNINDNCGSTMPMNASETVIAHGAHVGICLDGDADRCIILDETGKVADGDQFMGLIAGRWAQEGRLKGDTLVATVMSNLGLERHLESKGLTLARTGVGDRYVVEEMRKNDFNLGGEQSGHIVMTDYATTGDGLMAGLQFLGELARTGRKASELISVFEPVPQMLQNVRYAAGQIPLEDSKVQSVIVGAEKDLSGKGRLLIRKSGTEPLIRVMAECEDPDLLNEVVERIVGEVARATA
ncbi:MAG: phosphoglucosamine mutase [Planktotalea sp.]|uniref:phosphoglucosamine mutase n=1 Tax=Planktotalea sp. TaxID=2029877 RepID=UPI00260CD88E|nr:phosphoglucosamine mutase [Planktotalea sp.]MDG1077820.1 phosphoglucosamine mutase [Planktotalea sp.]